MSVTKKQFRRSLQRRRGVTIIEVLFSMGIALMGLAGIASLLLLAGGQASDSNRSAEAQGYSNEWYANFAGRGLNDTSRWYWYNDSPTPPASPGLVPFSKSLSDFFPSKGSTSVYRRELGRESVCLDPYFFASRDIVNAPEDTGWFRPSVFPYYADRYSPLLDPALAGSAWPDQPRMLRVTLGYTTASGITPLSSRVLESTFASEDDVAVFVNDADRAQPPDRMGEVFSTATPKIARYSNENKYSWLATLTPNEPKNSLSSETDLYTLSLVVSKSRDRLYIPTAIGSRASSAPADVRATPQGERLTYVVTQSGNFSGGNGGRVRLIGNDASNPVIRVGDWIMLSKYYNFEILGPTPPLNIRPNSLFRWYRIVAVDSDETYITMPDPISGDPSSVWYQDVVLDGPDWIFDETLAVKGVTFQTPTCGTLVRGATSVFERVVSIPN